MLNLNGLVSVDVMQEIDSYTDLRVRDRLKYKCAEALALYEQRLLPNDVILDLCENASNDDLFIPATSYVPNEYLMHFRGTNLVPVSFSPMRGTITCVALAELDNSYIPLPNAEVIVVNTPIYNYFKEYTRQYGPHPDLLEVPGKILMESIVSEAISLGASDITISSDSHTAKVYYNVRKRKVYSQRILDDRNIDEIIKLYTFESPMDYTTNKPKYTGVTLNDEYRGRVVINHKFHGFAITIRLLPNGAFDKTLEDINLSKETTEFMRYTFMNRELGLRLIAGSTMAGKNSTCLASLNELTWNDTMKVVSIEMPVEQELRNVEQINCEDEEEYDANINSLLRQNPDFVYVTEIGDTTANSVMRVTNTGKRVLSTIHANSCADVIGRIQDITGLSLDRIIQTIHSIVYQELVRDEDEDKLYPKNKYVYLSRERKAQLYGKSYGEIIMKINSWEGGDVW